MITFWTIKETTRKLRLDDQYTECFVLGEPISLRVHDEIGSNLIPRVSRLIRALGTRLVSLWVWLRSI